MLNGDFHFHSVSLSLYLTLFPCSVPLLVSSRLVSLRISLLRSCAGMIIFQSSSWPRKLAAEQPGIQRFGPSATTPRHQLIHVIFYSILHPYTIIYRFRRVKFPVFDSKVSFSNYVIWAKKRNFPSSSLHKHIPISRIVECDDAL